MVTEFGVSFHLTELVGDQHDGRAGAGQPADGLQKSLGFSVGENRGGLVENENLCTADQNLDDLDLLLLGHRQRVDAAVGIDGETEIGGLPFDGGADVAYSGAIMGAAIGEQDIFGDCEWHHQLEMLVHHADAQTARLGRAAQRYGVAVDQDAAGLGRVEAGGHVHQRRFARTVLAEEGVYLPGVAAELRVVENNHTVK